MVGGGYGIIQVSPLQPNIPHVLVHVDWPILFAISKCAQSHQTEQIVLRPLTFKALYGKLCDITVLVLLFTAKSAHSSSTMSNKVSL